MNASSSAPSRAAAATPWLVGAALAAFALFLLALAFPPAPPRGDGGGHALSRTPVGYAGLVRLLDGVGATALVSRTGARPPGMAGALLVLTPLPETTPAEVLKLASSGKVLIVPPKWETAPDLRAPGRVLRLGMVPPSQTLRFARAVLARGADGGAPGVVTITRRMSPSLAPAEDVDRTPTTGPLGSVEALRTFTGGDMLPVVLDARGQTLVARMPGRSVYVLSDPDLLNNRGVADLRTARAAVALVDALAENQPVVWDVTLDGIVAKAPVRSALRALFEPPLLPATLCLFVAAALAALAARERFGAMEDASRAYAFGKRALVDSAASLIALAGREPRFAPRYAELARAAAVEAAGLSAAGRDAQDAALDRIGERRAAGGWSQVRDVAQAVTGARSLLASARRTWTWRREMTRGRG